MCQGSQTAFGCHSIGKLNCELLKLTCVQLNTVNARPMFPMLTKLIIDGLHGIITCTFNCNHLKVLQQRLYHAATDYMYKSKRFMKPPL